jgi:predicted Zn-dependent protease
MVAQGRLNAAEVALERARIFDPNAPQILMALSHVALNRGDTETARSRMSDAAHMSTEDPRPWLAYGRLEMAFGDEAVGTAALHQALALGDPWQARAALIARSIRAHAPSPLLDAWKARDETDPIALRRRAGLRAAAQDHSGAVADYLEVVATTGRDLSIVAPLVQSSTQGAQIATTLLGAEAVVREQPGASAAWMVIGLLSSLIGDDGATIDALQMAEAQGVSLGEGPRQSLERARASQSKQPEQPAGRVPLLDDPVNRAMRLVEQREWAAAELSLSSSLMAFPDDPRLLYILSDLHLKRDGPAAALPHVEKILSVKPSFGPALNLWAWIQAEQGTQFQEAKNKVMIALNRQPRLGSYWDTLGWINHLRGHHGLAKANLSRAHRLSPKDDTIRAHLDACLSNHGVHTQ